jgi:MFS family permease
MPRPVFAAMFLFNLGQGILRPAMPLYLQGAFTASYTMVTLIPLVFGVGKWIANIPSGYLMDRVGRRGLMTSGLLLIAAIDILSVITPDFRVFLILRGAGGTGWAVFATVATTVTVDGRAADRRGRAVSLLLMSETLGLLLGSAAGGWVYQRLGPTGPFFFEAASLVLASVVLLRIALPRSERPTPRRTARPALAEALHARGIVLMGVTSAVLVAIQTGVMVFLFPLYLVERRAAGPGLVGVLVSLTVLGRLGALWLGGNASDRWGRMRVLSIGLLGYAGVLASLTFFAHPAAVAAWSVAAGGAAGFVMALPIAVVGDRVPAHLQGVAIGWVRTMADTGQILGPLLMGKLADAVDVTAPFACAALMLIPVAWRCSRLRVAG